MCLIAQEDVALEETARLQKYALVNPVSKKTRLQENVDITARVVAQGANVSHLINARVQQDLSGKTTLAKQSALEVVSMVFVQAPVNVAANLDGPLTNQELPAKLTVRNLV